MTNLNEKCYVGIDVSKAILEVFILPSKKSMQFKNTAQGINKLVRKLNLFACISIVMEATGGYEKAVAQALAKEGIEVAVVNPRRMRDFAKALGMLAKTDRIDAQVIALFSKTLEPRVTVRVDETQQTLADSYTRPRQLIEMIGMQRNRLDKLSAHLQKSIGRILKVLEKEVERITAALEHAIQNEPHLAQKNDLLQSIKGVGSVVAAGMIAQLPELGRISAKQITALVGLAPYARDSGTFKGKRTTWGGRACVRTTLYMAALVSVRYNARIKAFYQRLCLAGKAKKSALVACMHKLLIIMNAMVKHNQPWREIPL